MQSYNYITESQLVDKNPPKKHNQKAQTWGESEIFMGF